MTSPAQPNRVSPFRPFRHRAFATVWAGSFVSNIGTWMETVAIGVYVTQATGQAAWTGTVAALTYVPTVLLGPFGGALADRFDRRRFLVGVTLFQTLLATVLTVLAATDRLSVAAVATIVLLAGCAFAVAMPAVQAMTPDLVGTDDLLGAMSLGAAQYNLGRVVGPALAGLVITAGGLAWAFGFNVISFGAVLLALAVIRIPPLARTDGPPARVLRTIADGMVAARRDAGIRTALLLLVATTFLVSPFIGLVPAVAIKVFDQGASGTAALVTAQGVGAVSAALAAAPLAARLGRRRLLVAALLAVGPAAVLYGLAPSFPLAVAAIAVLGFVYLADALGHQHGLPAPGPARAAGPDRQPVHARGGWRARPRAGRAGLARGPGRAAGRHRRHRPAAHGHRGHGPAGPPPPAGGDGARRLRGCPSAPGGGRPGPGRPG